MKKEPRLKRLYFLYYRAVCAGFLAVAAVLLAAVLLWRQPVLQTLAVAGLCLLLLVFTAYTVCCCQQSLAVFRFLNRLDREAIDRLRREQQDKQYHVLLCDTIEHLKQLIDAEELAKLLRRQTEFATLQSQINPHFLYNTLESIRGEALIQGQSQIAEMTEALSAFFRYSISMKNDLVTLADELKNAQNYFKIQQYRFGERISLCLWYDQEEPELLEYVLPKLTLQPILENAISHGLEQKEEKGEVTVTILTTQKRLLITIKDNGAGICEQQLRRLNQRLLLPVERAAETAKDRNGIALTNVCQRIRLFFGEEYGLTVSSIEGEGTEVEITVPRLFEYELGKKDST